jgi:uridylate cyclase
MSIADDIHTEVREIFKAAWTTRDGQKVPEDADLKLSNDAVELDAAVLYADLAESTKLVTDKEAKFAAEIYKTYLKSACRVIRGNGGVITAFDGDRVMAVFIGDSKNTSAVKSALKINGAVEILNAELKGVYTKTDYVVRHAVGVDAGRLLVAKTGIRGSNDLVWVGLAANRAAKLCALRDGSATTWISSNVYDSMHNDAKVDPNGTNINMWTKKTWTAYNTYVYSSSWWWKP